MQRKRGISVWQLIIAFTMLYTVMPIVSRFVSTYLTTYFYMLVVVAVVVAILFAKRGDSFNEYAGGVLLPFILYYACTYFLRTNSITLWGYQILLELLPIIIGYYITRYKQQQVKFYSQVLCVALIITMITTCIGLIRFPSAARILATIASSQDAAAITYNWNNIGGFSFIYTIVLLYPIFIMAYKQKKINLFLTICGTVLIYATVLLSEYATALLLLMLSTALFFVKKNLTKRDVRILLLIGLVVLVLFSSFLSQLLTYVGGLTGSQTLSTRFTALAGGQTGLESTDDNRIQLYQRSFTTFLQHPLLGTFLSGGGGVGGHSNILDILGQYGLLGATLLYFMYRKIYRYFVAPFQDKPGYGFVLWTFMQAILLSVLNPGMWLSVLTLMVPIFVGHIYGYGDTSYENSLDCQYAVRAHQ
jgi:hypothetical protein